MTRVLQAAVAALFLALTSPAVADLGDPDPTFGVEGTAPVPMVTCNQCTHIPVRLAVQPDGRIAVMSLLVYPGFHGIYDNGVQVSRLMPDGSVDPGFNGGAPRVVFGADWLSYRFGGDPGGAIGLQPDGKIVIADQASSPCQSAYCPTELAVVRLMPDGTPDPDFGTSGIARFPVSLRSAVGLGVRADGRIVVAVRAGPSPSFNVFRLMPDGSLDATFGNGGVVGVTMPNDDGNPFQAGTFSLLPDGRMLIARYLSLTVARLTPEGALDTTFNGTGTASWPLMGSAMLAQPDGSVFVAANDVSSGPGRVMKVGANGALDATWGDAGVRLFGEGFYLKNLGLDGDGRLVGFGTTLSRAAVRRWLPDGKTDGTLRGAGYAISNVPSSTQLQGMQVVVDQVVANVGTSIARFGGPLDVAGSNRIFVEQQFRDFLGRGGDPDGIAYWQARLDAGGLARAQLVRQFLESPEFQAGIAPIVRLYLAYFLRAPDLTGLLFWSDQVKQAGLAAVSNAFAQSAEFSQRYGSLDNTQFVGLVYNNILGRAADPGGFAHWRNKLDTGEMTRGQVMLAFSESAEYLGVSFNEVMATMTYYGMLRRMPDTDGFGHWVRYLDNGNPPESFIGAFVASEEYRARFDP